MVQQPFSFENSEGIPIRGDVFSRGSGGESVVVCIHGFKGFKDWGFWPETTRRLCDDSHAVVRFNFAHSGFGESTDSMTDMELFERGTYSREVRDLEEVLSRLAAGNLPGIEAGGALRVGLLAHSRGSVSALSVAASRGFPVRAVVLWNPVSSVLWWDEETRRRWRESGSWEVLNTRTGQVLQMKTSLLDDAEQNRDRLDPVGNAERIGVPLLCVVATEDDAVPAASGRRLARAAGTLGSVREIGSTGHTFGAGHPFGAPTPALEEALLVTREHFDRTLRQP